ncbi:MAG: flagellar assembly protein FliW [Dehalococcoidia bacterium]
MTHRYARAERVEVAASDIFELTPGLAGFEHLHRYAIIPEDDSPVEWLQSLEDPTVAFATIEPFLFYPEYAFELSDHDCDELGLRVPQSAIVRCLLTLSTSADQITANLLAPLVLNRDTCKGRQVILPDSNLSVRFHLFQALHLPLSA